MAAGGPNQIPFVATMDYSAVTKGIQAIGQRVKAIERTTNLLGSALNRLKMAAQFYITFRIFSAIYKGINALTGAIPTLLRRGDEWLRQLDKLQDVTGMTAAQVSKLAFVARYVGADVDKLGRDLSYLARNVVENEENFKRFGITVRDESGKLKDSYEIFQDVRRALSTYGRQFISSAAAQRIFSEGGRELMDILTMTDRQYERLTGLAERYGFVMSQAAISGAEAWRNAQSVMQMQIDAIGAQILGGIAPVLTALTSGVTKSIQDNMTNIVNFVQRVVVVVAGFIGGLLGIDLSLQVNRAMKAAMDLANGMRRGASSAGDYGKAMEDAAEGTDKGTSAIDKQIAALDRQLARLDRIEDRRRARREYQEMKADIEEARRDLNELRSEYLFESGMSLVEAELARQAHAGDIIEGEKRLAEAKKKLRQWEKQQEIDAERDRLQRMRDALQDRLSAMTAATAKAATSMANAFQGIPQGVENAFKKSSFKIDANLKKLLRDTQKMGSDANEAIMSALFGEAVPGKFAMPEGKKLGFGKGESNAIRLERIRGGGLIEHLNNLGSALQSLTDLVLDIYKELEKLRPPEKPTFEVPVRDEEGTITTKKLTPSDALPRQPTDITNLKWFLDSAVGENTGWLPQSINAIAGFFNGKDEENRGAWTDVVTGSGIRNPWAAAIGGGPVGVGATRWQPKDEDSEPLWRRYLGRNSPVVEGGEEQTGATWGVVGNTQPISDGTLGTAVTGWNVTGNIGTAVGNRVDTKVDNVVDTRIGNKVSTDVTNPKLTVDSWRFKNIGKVNKWSAGAIPVVAASSKGWNVLDKSRATVGKQNVMINILQNIRDYILWASHGGPTWAFDVHTHYSKGYAAGTRYVPETGPALLHRGEMVLNPSQARQAGGGPTSITLQLDARATRDLLMGRPMTTTTRPLTGT